MPVRFLVFGAGALGSLVGGLLSQSHDTVLVGRRAHVEAIRRNGLRITGRTEAVVRPTAVERVEGTEDPDVVLVTVKAYDTSDAAEALRPFWETATFLSLQNGLGNEEALAARVARVLGGVTTHGVTFVEPGTVRHAGVGATHVGPFQGLATADARRVAAAFDEGGMECRVTEDIQRELWLKALVNACINPVTALLRAPNGVLRKAEALRTIVEAVVAEGVAAASLHGIDLGAETVRDRVATVVEATAENRSSMLQDLERGRRTEIEAINGAIVRRAEAMGGSAPVNRLLTLLVQAAEETSRREGAETGG